MHGTGVADASVKRLAMLACGRRRTRRLAERSYPHLPCKCDVAGARARQRHLLKVAHMITVDPELIARLRSAKILQAGRSVARKHNQGNARRFRLEHRRIVIGHRCPRGADDACRPARRLREPERKERSTPFVDIDVQIHTARMGNHGKRSRA